MKALAYEQSHLLNAFSIQETEVAEPTLQPTDLLVQVKAISVNPVDYKVRMSRSGSKAKPVLLGWDVSGVILAVGPDARGFSSGDEVFYAGDLLRDGGYAERQAVDFRLVAKKPKTLNFPDSAALPLTALTAWEALLERGTLETKAPARVLVVGGAGGVGSMAIQLLKAKTKAQVLATASRPETAEWVKKMGADIVLNHRQDLPTALAEHGIKELDFVFSTTHSDQYLSVFPKILRPFGHLALIDDPKVFDITSYKQKSITVAWELMFTKTLFQFRLETQGAILAEIASLVDSGKLVSTVNRVFQGFSSDHIKKAHELLESSRSIGKISIQF